MHICFITSEYPKKGYPHGGVGTFVKTIAAELVKNGYQVSVVGISYDATEELVIEQGVEIYRLVAKKIRGLYWLNKQRAIEKKIHEIHAKNKIDIIETAELGLAFFRKKASIKYIIRLHGGHHFFAESENRKIDLWKGFQERKSFKKADGFIAVSQYVKKHTSKYLSYNNKPIEVISYPISTEKFYPSNIEKIVPYKIVFAGTVCEKKGIRQLLLALPIVHKNYPESRLDVFGRDWFFSNGSSYIDFLKKTIPAETFEWVSFHGAVPMEDLVKNYEKATVCVFPSHMETQGLVAPEAMAMEKPVIFSIKGPGPETIEDGVTGLLCDPLDPNDIAAKIISVFDASENALIMGKNARQFVMKKYNIEKIVNQNMNFYKSIIQK